VPRHDASESAYSRVCSHSFTSMLKKPSSKEILEKQRLSGIERKSRSNDGLYRPILDVRGDAAFQVDVKGPVVMYR
jgi:hypothetical protein